MGPEIRAGPVGGSWRPGNVFSPSFASFSLSFSLLSLVSGAAAKSGSVSVTSTARMQANRRVIRNLSDWDVGPPGQEPNARAILTPLREGRRLEKVTRRKARPGTGGCRAV